MDKKKFLKSSCEYYRNSNSLIVKVGCELEFFLLGANNSQVDEFIAELQNKDWQVERERGASQIEIKTDFTADLEALCIELEEKKKFVRNLATEKKLIASFAAQPFLDDCGSALQFNISLHNSDDENIFLTDEKILQNSIDSLLNFTNQMMIFLAPKKEDYLRFSREINQKLFQKGKFTAPINLSFGNDNRTCAIRIKKTKTGKRLEYRVASADADPWLCISAIILALTQKSPNKFTPIFGNSFEEKFLLKEIIQSLEEAEKEFQKEENFIQKFFSR
ncbi:MAG: hypothetical protein KGP29_01425 [Proteobacteria bacterium]|nr:hypothetical protein [Pseudomonadota bacterium]